MSLEGLDLAIYLENLVPGTAMLISLIILLPSAPTEVQSTTAYSLFKDFQFILVAGFLSMSYLLGLLSAIISRFVVDGISEALFRPMLMRWLSHTSYKQLQRVLRPLPEEKPRWRGAWNQAYRAALSYITLNGPDRAREEVWRRREQGRLVRNLFFPLVLGSMALSQWLHVEPVEGVVGVAASVALFSICAYSYAEYTTFAEAILHLPSEAGTSTP